MMSCLAPTSTAWVGSRSISSYQTLRKAALAGRGIGLLPIRLVRDELGDGSLVHVLPDCEVPDRPLYALYAPGGQTLARVQLFMDFVTDWFRRQARSQQAVVVRGADEAVGSKTA